MSKPVGPYSPVVVSGEWIICSGQVGIRDGALVAGGMEAETRQAFENLRSVLASVDATLDHVVKTTVFLADMADYAAMNALYISEFGDHRPARSAIQAGALPLGAAIEIEAWARRPSS